MASQVQHTLNNKVSLQRQNRMEAANVIDIVDVVDDIEKNKKKVNMIVMWDDEWQSR